MSGPASELWAGVLPHEAKTAASGVGGEAQVAGAGLRLADDVTLAREAVGGAPGAFDLIVERHRQAVYRLCYRYVSNHEDASDLTQDAFVRAYRGLHRFRGEASLRTWLYRIAVNVCLNRVTARTAAGDRLDAAHAPVSDEADPGQAVLREEARERVRAAIARLPKRQRTVLILRAYQDLPHQEIARIVGSSVGAVKANLFHALRNLKKRLAEP